MQIEGLIYNISNGCLYSLSNDESLQLKAEFNNIVDKGDVNTNTLELIKHFESAHDGDKVKPGLQPKMDPVGIWTVGYGRALRFPGGTFMRGDKDKKAAYSHPLGNLTIEQATKLLEEDTEEKYMPLVLNLVDENKFNADQLGALCSFCYNCGTHYKNSKGKNIPFAIWKNVQTMNSSQLKNYWESSVIRGNGKVLPGLVRRRKSEYHLFSTGKLKFEF